MTEHHTSVFRTGIGWMAHCRCGWTSATARDAQLDALRDGDGHRTTPTIRHNTYIGPPVWGRPDRTTFVGYCDCGWYGGEHSDAGAASSDIDIHRVAVRTVRR